MSWLLWIRNSPPRREAISEEIARKKVELEERKSGYDREQLDSLTASGGDPRRLEEIHSRLAYIGGEIKYINETKALIIEYLKDKREMLDKVPDWTAESLRLQQIIHGEQEELKKRLADVNRNIFKIDAELKELKEANRKALENREEYHRSTLLDWFTSRESVFSSMNRTDTNGDCRSLVREITICVSEQSQKLSELRKEITAYTGNFSEDNVFAFKTSFSDDKEYMDFACDLKEFIDEDKVSEYQLRINTRNSDIFRQITADTKSMVSQEGNIRGVVDQINADFKEKNFVGIIQCIEMRIDPSQNKIVNLLKEIKRFNEEYSWDLGQNLFASSADDTAIREKATTLLRELIKSMDAYSGNLIRLADFFDLKFRVIENRNDTGFVERLTNVGSEGTDILVKSMVNIMLLNVFKRNASTVFSDFKLHCMMDEIGKLHPNNVAGILKFANDRDILLINGSPTEQDALSYKHIYKLEKDTDSFTRIRRVITQFD
ncbi:MAG: ATP-binding protein [Parabacteroides distasonis]